MTDKELLIASILGSIAFYLVTRYIIKHVTGTDKELKTKKTIRTISIIYGVGMIIQMISIISRLIE